MTDPRTPVASWEFQGYHISLLLPDTGFMLLVLGIVFLEIGLAILMAVVTYYGIVQQKNRHTALLIGWGVVLPLSSYIPWILIESFNIENVALRMTLAPPPMMVTLRCLEALGGFVPEGPKSSLREYIYYMGLFLVPKADSKTGRALRATRASIMSQFWIYLPYQIAHVVLYSWFKPRQYEVCPSQSDRAPTDIFVTFDPCQLLTNYAQAVLVAMSLSLGLSGISLTVQLLFQVQTQAAMDNPLFESTSPSDFWGRRWNLIVHSGLKQGIYKPVYSWFNSAALASLAAFIMSGLLHEHVWMILFHRHHSSPVLGKSILFFGWNGVLVAIEYLIGREQWLRLTKPLPGFVLTLIVVMMALPVGHLFTADMAVRESYFDGVSIGIPIVVVTKYDT